MKDSTKNKIKETARKGAIKTKEVAAKVKKLSDETVSRVKGKIPSRKEVKDATKAIVKFASKTALATKERTKKITGKISTTSRDIAASVKEGVAEAKQESDHPDDSL